jgi:hypothetical protein
MIIKAWFDWLDMPKYDEKWHQDDMADELAEYHEAPNLLYKISEASDVTYTYERAKWSGHSTVDFPLSKRAYYAGLVYGAGKYTSRFLFFKVAGKRSGAFDLRSVRNPKKVKKLHDIATKANLDPVKFQKICEKQLRYWPLLP